MPCPLYLYLDLLFLLRDTGSPIRSTVNFSFNTTFLSEEIDYINLLSFNMACQEIAVILRFSNNSICEFLFAYFPNLFAKPSYLCT